ncbi:MAG: hypothetical protein ABSE82_16060 [Nitrososphaerales archaeon]
MATQPICPPQAGEGILPVADWWLTSADAGFGMVAAAAAPAITMDKAKMRITSFIDGNPQGNSISRRRCISSLPIFVIHIKSNRLRNRID